MAFIRNHFLVRVALTSCLLALMTGCLPGPIDECSLYFVQDESWATTQRWLRYINDSHSAYCGPYRIAPSVFAYDDIGWKEPEKHFEFNVSLYIECAEDSTQDCSTIPQEGLRPDSVMLFFNCIAPAIVLPISSIRAFSYGLSYKYGNVKIPPGIDSLRVVVYPNLQVPTSDLFPCDTLEFKMRRYIHCYNSIFIPD